MDPPAPELNSQAKNSEAQASPTDNQVSLKPRCSSPILSASVTPEFLLRSLLTALDSGNVVLKLFQGSIK